MSDQIDHATTSQPIAGLPLFNLARGAKVLALLFFFLPWVTVSCAGQELASMSGYNMAMGSVTITNPMTGASETPPGGGERDLPVAGAALVILVVLGLSFVLPRALGGLVSAAGALLAAALISYTVFVRVPARMNEAPAAPPGGTGMNGQNIAEMIRIDTQIGFWLTLAALLAAAALAWAARTRGA